MRLSDRKFAARSAWLGLIAVTLAGCGSLFASDDVAYEVPPPPKAPGELQPAKPVQAVAVAPGANGPASDYPVVIGDPYVVNGVTYTPADVWNYDEVGYLAMDRAAGNAISGAHHTLPLPSYVEVTSLDTGKTILVRLERRGPMNGSQVISLSPGAIAQLGASPTTPVRVRRVNPQEPERAALRAGQRAPDRMDTPMSLVNVLKLKLPNGAAPAPVAVAAAPSSGLALPPLEDAPPPKAAAPKPAPKPAVAAASVRGGFVVQAGAFSAKGRADQVARAIGGQVTSANGLYRVRVGPFASRQAAEASLAKVRAAGYSEARIYSNG